MTENRTGRRPRVLVGVDGSAPARAALEFAIGEARQRDAVLVAVMAVHVPDYAWLDPYGTRSHPDEDVLRLAREKLDRMLASVGTEGLELDPVVTAEPAPRALVNRSADCDLLVVGSRGHGGFRGLVLGSVSMQCVLHAHCPVTVVRAEPQPAERHRHQTLAEARAETTAPFF
jgi:nucleotide-binding universal stress UspA family protein